MGEIVILGAMHEPFHFCHSNLHILEMYIQPKIMAYLSSALSHAPQRALYLWHSDVHADAIGNMTMHATNRAKCVALHHPRSPTAQCKQQTHRGTWAC